MIARRSATHPATTSRASLGRRVALLRARGTSTMAATLMGRSEWSGVWALGSADHLVDEAPPPGLARLDRAHHRVLCLVEVAGRVPHLGGVAAADVPAPEAEAQVHPRRAVAQALLAPLGGTRPDARVALLQVLAGSLDRVHGQHLTLCQAAVLVVDPVEHGLLEVERAQHHTQHGVVGPTLVTQPKHLLALRLQHLHARSAVPR